MNVISFKEKRKKNSDLSCEFKIDLVIMKGICQ